MYVSEKMRSAVVMRKHSAALLFRLVLPSINANCFIVFNVNQTVKPIVSHLEVVGLNLVMNIYLNIRPHAPLLSIGLVYELVLEHF